MLDCERPPPGLIGHGHGHGHAYGAPWAGPTELLLRQVCDAHELRLLWHVQAEQLGQRAGLGVD